MSLFLVVLPRTRQFSLQPSSFFIGRECQRMRATLQRLLGSLIGTFPRQARKATYLAWYCIIFNDLASICLSSVFSPSFACSSIYAQRCFTHVISTLTRNDMSVSKSCSPTLCEQHINNLTSLPTIPSTSQHYSVQHIDS